MAAILSQPGGPDSWRISSWYINYNNIIHIAYSHVSLFYIARNIRTNPLFSYMLCKHISLLSDWISWCCLWIIVIIIIFIIIIVCVFVVVIVINTYCKTYTIQHDCRENSYFTSMQNDSAWLQRIQLIHKYANLTISGNYTTHSIHFSADVSQETKWSSWSAIRKRVLV